MDEDFPKNGGFEGAGEILEELKNCSIMLTVGNDYLCEEVLLRKMGEEIAGNLGLLNRCINEVKGQFVGKPAQDMDLEEDLNELAGLAASLKRAEERSKEDCAKGRLGKELNEKVVGLIDKVKLLRGRLEGEEVFLSSKKRPLGLFARLGIIQSELAGPFRAVLKGAAVLLVICLGVFGFLFFTMESEKAVSNKIEDTRSLIRSDKRELSRINEEIDKLKAAISELEQNKMSRRDEVEIMDLRVKEHSLVEQREEVLIDKEAHQEELEKYRKRLKEIREKGFMERLLRR